MSGAGVSVVEFDFAQRRERTIEFAQVRDSCSQGLSCWIDIDSADPKRAEALLREFGIDVMVIDEALLHPVVGRHDVYEHCLHVALAAPEVAGQAIRFVHVDMIIGERFLITLHHGPVEFLEQTRRSYHHFFSKFAQSLGFLLFELWDHLIEAYRRAFSRVEKDVDFAQKSIFGEVDDRIFSRVAEITEVLLVLRRNVLADREVLHQMAIHKSSFVPETTRPFLANLVGTFERLGSDLTVERETLAETLTLYLGIVSHRTNRLLHRLTLVSMFFLPLTFLCGVYGMNFDAQPEFHWAFGYAFFWTLVLLTVVAMLILTRLTRMW